MIKGIKPSLAQAGAIKIGRLSEQSYQSKGGGSYHRPMKLDHFRVVKNIRDPDGHLHEDHLVMAALTQPPWVDQDGKCRTIPILLHSDVIDEVFPTVYATYAGKQIVCRGDGETATRWTYKDKVRTGETIEMKCPCPWLERDAKGVQHCKPHGTLHCTIALPDLAIAGAVYRWRTTGIVSIQRMIGSLEQILAAVGTLTGVPLVLRVEPVQVSPDGKVQTVYSCHVELRAQDLVAVQRRALEARTVRAQLGPATEMKLLVQPPASDDETPEERAEVEEEFYPEPAEPEAKVERPVESVKKAAKKTIEKQKAPPPEPEPPMPTDEPAKDDGPDYGTPDA